MTCNRIEILEVWLNSSMLSIYVLSMNICEDFTTILSFLVQWQWSFAMGRFTQCFTLQSSFHKLFYYDSYDLMAKVARIRNFRVDEVHFHIFRRIYLKPKVLVWFKRFMSKATRITVDEVYALKLSVSTYSGRI